jgi:hypothetical protein
MGRLPGCMACHKCSLLIVGHITELSEQGQAETPGGKQTVLSSPSYWMDPER